ncbi:hypothetical protein EVAR_46172_1 [Eumeta japonica]|uniref:Uncharacterized protein n=1 Tax=Eumeta variegata TaxID=151549 RepID=A0A4C1Y373_EUMVA|nr:hypothetical protein EVAR_46172_1 [Eumeta japonica]
MSHIRDDFTGLGSSERTTVDRAEMVSRSSATRGPVVVREFVPRLQLFSPMYEINMKVISTVYLPVLTWLQVAVAVIKVAAYCNKV